MNLRSVAATAACLASSVIFSEAESAAPPQVSSAFAAAKSALQELSRRGKTLEGSPISFAPADMTYVGDAADGIVYVEQIATLGSLAVKTRLPVTGQAERPSKDLTEIVQTLYSACSTEAGMVDVRQPPLGFEQASMPLVARTLNTLITEKLVGQFWCTDASRNPLFMVEILPASGATSAPLSLGWDWYIAIELITPGALKEHQSSRARYRQSVTELRKGVQPGRPVQVMSTDLPEAFVRQWSLTYRNRPGALCATVAEVKGPSAVVQINAEQLVVDLNRLLPQGERKRVNELRISDLRQPQRSCVF